MVQITCDKEVVAEFLRLMRRANIRQLEQEADPLALLADNPAVGGDRERLKTAHLETIAAQWRR